MLTRIVNGIRDLILYVIKLKLDICNNCMSYEYEHTLKVEMEAFYFCSHVGNILTRYRFGLNVRRITVDATANCRGLEMKIYLDEII